MFLAANSEYASSPSGWVISVLLTIIGVGGWYYWRKNEKTTDKHTDALGLILQTQAVILQRIGPLESSEQQHESKIQKLDNDMAVVRDVVNRHEKWHERSDPLIS